MAFPLRYLLTIVATLATVIAAHAGAACEETAAPQTVPAEAPSTATGPGSQTPVTPVPTAAPPAAGGRWQRLPPLPAARSEVAAAALGGRVYVLGGLTPGGGATDRVEAYDPVASVWEERASMPRPLHHAAAAVADGRL